MTAHLHLRLTERKLRARLAGRQAAMKRPIIDWKLTVATLAALLAECAASPPPMRIKQVRVPVPVPCRVSEPARPLMPTETLQADTKLDTFAAAAIAEIERRESYEGELRAALAACAAPVEGD